MFSITTFGEVLKGLPRSEFDRLVARLKADKYIKKFRHWNHLVAMLFAQYSGASGLRPLEATFNQQAVHHYHLGVGSISRSTLADANENRSDRVFSAIAAYLMTKVSGHLRKEVRDFLYLLDSSSITLKGREFERWTAKTRTRNTQGIKLHLLLDAHSQAPAPVSALMSGVLLAVALTSLLRVKAVVDAALGVGFMRAGLLSLGLLTLVVAAGLLIAQRDFKRLLAYSSMEQMAFAAIAAAATNPLAVSAVLLLVIVHGLAKAVMFIVSGHLQQAHRSTAIPAIRGLLARSPALAAAAITGLCALVGLPPFGIFPAELAAGRGLADAGLAWPLGVALLFVLVAVAALASRGGAMLFGDADAEAPPIRLDRLDLAVLGGGITGCLVFGLTAGPLNPVLMSAGHLLAGGS